MPDDTWTHAAPASQLTHGVPLSVELLYPWDCAWSGSTTTSARSGEYGCFSHDLLQLLGDLCGGAGRLACEQPYATQDA